MSGTKRVILCFVFLSFLAILSSNGVVTASQCVITTVPKEVVFPPDWFGGMKIYSSADAVNRGNHVDAWVESTNLPCPPYTWVLTQLNGNGFSVSKTETTSELETVQLSADATACGSCTITVTDASDAQSVAGFRCPDSGQWDSGNCLCDAYGRNGYPFFSTPVGNKMYEVRLYGLHECCTGDIYGTCSSYCYESHYLPIAEYFTEWVNGPEFTPPLVQCCGLLVGNAFCSNYAVIKVIEHSWVCP